MFIRYDFLHQRESNRESARQREPESRRAAGDGDVVKAGREVGAASKKQAAGGKGGSEKDKKNLAF